MKIVSFLVLALLSTLGSAKKIVNKQFLVEEPEGDRDLKKKGGSGGCNTVTSYITIRRPPSWSSRTQFKRIEAICNDATGKNVATELELSASGDCDADSNQCSFPTGNSALCRVGAANVQKGCEKRDVPVKLELTCCKVH